MSLVEIYLLGCCIALGSATAAILRAYVEAQPEFAAWLAAGNVSA